MNIHWKDTAVVFTDDAWQFRDPLGSAMHELHMFARTGTWTLDGFSGLGADWLARFKPYIEDGKTGIVSPHNMWAPVQRPGLAAAEAPGRESDRRWDAAEYVRRSAAA